MMFSAMLLALADTFHLVEATHIATFVLVSIVLFAAIGIHQFALVAIFMGFFADVTTTPTLMAIAYIMGTSISMSGSSAKQKSTTSRQKLTFFNRQ
jgi:hypothetical protein